MFLSSPLPSLRPSAAAAAAASTPNPDSDSLPLRPTTLLPPPSTSSGGRAKWLADKRFKVDRSPDLAGGNGFQPHPSFPSPSTYASSLPSPSTSRSASAAATPSARRSPFSPSSPTTTPLVSLKALLASLRPSKRKLKTSSTSAGVAWGYLTVLVLGALFVLRSAVHQYAPQTLLSTPPSSSSSSSSFEFPTSDSTWGHPSRQRPTTTSDLLLPIEYSQPFTTAAVAPRRPHLPVGGGGVRGRSAGFFSRLFTAGGGWGEVQEREVEQQEEEEEEQGRHKTLANGLLEVDPEVPATEHPIYQLIADAQTAWEAKLARQSTTLEQAVAEYARRHAGLAPPKGFDRWFAYVQAHNVGLPDEYDQIERDLAPFRALAPSVLRQRIAELQDPSRGFESFTLSVKGGRAFTSEVTYDEGSIGGALDRRVGQLGLIDEIAHLLPDFEAVYSIHDAPTRFVSYGHRADLAFAAEQGVYLDPTDEVDVDGVGWAAACPYTSALRRGGLTTSPASSSSASFDKSFIASHLATMDPCDHPSLTKQHGLLLSPPPIPQPALLPLFSLSKTTLHADILGIPVEQHTDHPAPPTPWVDKTDDHLLWRGRNTGNVFTTELDWRASHRARLASLSTTTSTGGGGGRRRVPLLPPPSLASPTHSLANQTLDHALPKLASELLDVGLAYAPIQCVEADGSCAAVQAELEWRDVKTFEEEGAYKFILDVDGNAWSARFNRLLSTGSLVLKSTIFPEWWNDRVQPWYHYVPVKVDYSDVFDTLSFFRSPASPSSSSSSSSSSAGSEDPPSGDELASLLASRGLAWSQTYWRKQDMTAYLFRLYLEYARLVAVDRSDLDFVLPDDEVELDERPTRTVVHDDEDKASPDANWV